MTNQDEEAVARQIRAILDNDPACGGLITPEGLRALVRLARTPPASDVSEAAYKAMRAKDPEWIGLLKALSVMTRKAASTPEQET